MRVRSLRLFSAGLMIAVIGGVATAVPAAAASRISYSGQSFAVKTVVSSTTTVLADTGSLPSTGGTQEGSALSGTVPNTLNADTLHATTIGQGDRVRSEASLEIIGVTAGVNSVTADLAMSRSMAVSHAGNATVSGASLVDNLIVNGVPVVVTGQANQIVPLVNGQLVVNEQSSSVSGDTGSITVNAMHLTISGGADITLGSSRAGVVAGSNNCASTNDFTTGGGWLPPAGASKRTFGFMGGIRQNQTFQGHVLYVNHALNERLDARVNLYVILAGNNRHMEGTGQVNGQAAAFQLDVADNGEPGSLDTFSLTYQSPNGTGGDTGTLAGGNIQLHVPCR